MYKYLITGGRGFIGRNLTNTLDMLGKSYKVVDLDVLGYPNDKCSDVTISIPPIQAETLVHLASETNVRKSIKSPRATIERNCIGLLNCLDLLKNDIVGRVVFTSSASSMLSLSPYLASKAACEHICKAYKECYNLDIRVLRLSNVYGPCSEAKDSVIPTFIKNVIKYENLTIYGKGEQRRDFIYVFDVVNAIISGRSGYISTGTLISVSKLAWMIQEISGKVLNRSPHINYEGEIKGEVGSPEFSKTSIKVKVDLEDGLLRTFKWFVRRYDGGKSKRLE